MQRAVRPARSRSPVRSRQAARPRRSVSSFLIDSARQSRLSDLLGRSTRWFRRDPAGQTGAENAKVTGRKGKKKRGAFIGRGGTRNGIPSAVAAVCDCHRKSAMRFPAFPRRDAAVAARARERTRSSDLGLNRALNRHSIDFDSYFGFSLRGRTPARLLLACY